MKVRPPSCSGFRATVVWLGYLRGRGGYVFWGAGFPSEFGTNYSSGRIVFTLPGNWSDVGCGAPTTPPTPSGEGCSDGARAAVTVAGLALLLQVIVLIVN